MNRMVCPYPLLRLSLQVQRQQKRTAGELPPAVNFRHLGRKPQINHVCSQTSSEGLMLDVRSSDAQSAAVMLKGFGRK